MYKTRFSFRTLNYANLTVPFFELSLLGSLWYISSNVPCPKGIKNVKSTAKELKKGVNTK
jgi:hypothetical protein